MHEIKQTNKQAIECERLFQGEGSNLENVMQKIDKRLRKGEREGKGTEHGWTCAEPKEKSSTKRELSYKTGFLLKRGGIYCRLDSISIKMKMS